MVGACGTQEPPGAVAVLFAGVGSGEAKGDHAVECDVEHLDRVRRRRQPLRGRSDDEQLLRPSVRVDPGPVGRRQIVAEARCDVGGRDCDHGDGGELLQREPEHVRVAGIARRVDLQPGHHVGETEGRPGESGGQRTERDACVEDGQQERDPGERRRGRVEQEHRGQGDQSVGRDLEQAWRTGAFPPAPARASWPC